jgi:hypothetical protein
LQQKYAIDQTVERRLRVLTAAGRFSLVQRFKPLLLLPLALRDHLPVHYHYNAVNDLLSAKRQRYHHPQNGLACELQNVCPMLKTKLKWRSVSKCGGVVVRTGNTPGFNVYPRSNRMGPMGVL